MTLLQNPLDTRTSIVGPSLDGVCAVEVNEAEPNRHFVGWATETAPGQHCDPSRLKDMGTHVGARPKPFLHDPRTRPDIRKHIEPPTWLRYLCTARA